MSDEIDKAIAAMRKGDKIEVDGLPELDKRLSVALGKLSTIQKRGGVLVDRATGKRSDDATEVVEMIAGNLKAMRKGATGKQARANGRKGGRPPLVRATSREDAEKIWRNVAIKSNPAAVRMAPGWTLRTMQEAFGPSGRPVGRPRLKPAAKRPRK